MKYGDAPERAQGQKSGLSPRLVILFLRVSDVSALNDVFSGSGFLFRRLHDWEVACGRPLVPHHGGTWLTND